jgi:hypothetical protein
MDLSMIWTVHQVTHHAQSVAEFGHVQRGDTFVHDFAHSSLYSSFRLLSEGRHLLGVGLEDDCTVMMLPR